MISSHPRLFETDRLVIRPALPGDWELIYALWTDPQVMSFVGFPKGLCITPAELQERLTQADSSALDALLVIELKASGTQIGQCHLSYPDADGIAEPDIKLLPAFWGHGYGQEVWRAMVDCQFTHTDCQMIQGTPNVANIASIKMQEAAGAICTGEGVFHFPESMQTYTTPVHHYIYQLDRATWKQRQTGKL
jgi:RimJ/RimL family protein N-acetyltransferase